MANEQRLVVSPPEIRPRKFGLYSVAERHAAEPHSLMGIEQDHRDMFAGGTFLRNPIGVTWCGPSTAKVATKPTAGEGFDPVHVYGYMECAGVSDFNQAKNRAVRRFIMREERAVERALQNLFQDDTDGSSLTPAVTGAPVDLPTSLAHLEQAIDENYAGAGTIITSRAAVTLLSKNGVVQRHGNHLETEQGNYVFGSYYIDEGFGSDAPSDTTEAVMFATGLIEIREGDRFVSDPVFVDAGTNEVQTVSITGTPTGGTFTLTFDGQTTAAIAYNANAAAVQSALLALSNLDTGDVAVTGTNPDFTVTFGGDYADTNVAQMTADGSGLTGGTTPGVTVATETGGMIPGTDNTFRVLVEKSFLISYDMPPLSILATMEA